MGRSIPQSQPVKNVHMLPTGQTEGLSMVIISSHKVVEVSPNWSLIGLQVPKTSSHHWSTSYGGQDGLGKSNHQMVPKCYAVCTLHLRVSAEQKFMPKYFGNYFQASIHIFRKIF